jgi:hypothetical protein
MNKPKTRVVARVRRETVYVARRLARAYYDQWEGTMSTDEWSTISRTLDFILKQPTTKPIKESPASYGIRGEPEKPKRKPKKPKPEPTAEQLRMF